MGSRTSCPHRWLIRQCKLGFAFPLLGAISPSHSIPLAGTTSRETAHRPVSLCLRASQLRRGMCREALLSLCPTFFHTPGTAQAAHDLNSETKFKSWFQAFSCESLGLASVSHPLVCKLEEGMLIPRATFRAPPSLCSTQVMPLGV